MYMHHAWYCNIYEYVILCNGLGNDVPVYTKLVTMLNLVEEAKACIHFKRLPLVANNYRLCVRCTQPKMWICSSVFLMNIISTMSH